MSSESLMPVTALAPSDGQRLFVRYFTGVLIDLVVLNLFVEYTNRVFVDSFSISLMAALLLQILLKLTIAVEHKVMDFFKRRPGALMTFLKFFFAWVVLFGSKFVILEALSLSFGETVRFEGRWNGIVILIIVVVAMLLAEELVVRFYRWLGRKREVPATA
jgi:hypothetical protein